MPLLPSRTPRPPARPTATPALAIRRVPCDRTDPHCEPGCVRLEVWRGDRRLLCSHLAPEVDRPEAPAYARHYVEGCDQAAPVTRPQLVRA